MIVTIDGPAGSGKSTAARGLARRLGFQFLDTGAMYRVVTYVCLERSLNLSDEQSVAEVARNIRIQFQEERVFADQRDVTDAIRSSEVTQGTRFVAGNTAVRETLVELQRQAVAGRDVVSEGRDQGTVVFPFAECKFFLTADPAQRAARRHRDLTARGETISLEECLAQQADRDRRDELREVGPLKRADDAIDVDTSGLDHSQVLQTLEAAVRRRMRELGKVVAYLPNSSDG